MNKLKTIEYIIGTNYAIDSIKLLQKYFQVDWKFAKPDHIYYIDPESDMTMCQPGSMIFTASNRYIFKQINLNTVKKYVNRLQEQETNLDRRDQQPTSGIQCSTSKVTITSGHLEYGKIDFRWGGKAKIGKANLSF
jgi:hypothetical protein